MKTCESCKFSSDALCSLLSTVVDNKMIDWFADGDTVTSDDSTIAFNPHKQCPGYEEKGKVKKCDTCRWNKGRDCCRYSNEDEKELINDWLFDSFMVSDPDENHIPLNPVNDCPGWEKNI